MVMDIYINCTRFPEILITPILKDKRYGPIKFNCLRESIEQFRELLEKYSKKYRINYVLSEEQVDFLIKRDTKGKTIETIISMLEQQYKILK
ncbi:MAG: hypothetical protein N3G19_01295 [Candidatus Pacearchaeota archaeon]|nr:hypothetical protein [Candidatus Pacearchaeota archaeon]